MTRKTGSKLFTRRFALLEKCCENFIETFIRLFQAEAYSESCQASKIERLAEIVNG